MASHFTTIGLRIADKEDYQALDGRALLEGDQARRSTNPDGSYMPWPMGGGAELWTYVDASDRSLGFVPHFVAEARMAVRLEHQVIRSTGSALDGGFYLWVFDDAYPALEDYPLVVDVPDFRAFDDLILPAATTIAVVCFAHSLEIFADDQAMADTGSHMAAESLIPSGTFHPGGQPKDPMQAEAIINGVIQATEERTNGVTGERFVWMRIHTLGAHLEVIADPSIVKGTPVPGAIAGTVGWLAGRPDRVPRPLPELLVAPPVPVERGPLSAAPEGGMRGLLRRLARPRK